MFGVKEVNYTLTIVTVACLTWNEAEAKWYSDKCEMEWLPQYNKISCFCQEVTDLVFANSFFVAPNTIDFSTVFLKFSPLEQAAVMGAIAAIFLIYVIAVILLIGLDRQDQLKWGITPLRDNFVTDRHYYLIKVYTGLRRGAGTTSRIAFILTGSKGGTGPREMFDGVREEFSTGSVMTFFMATAKPLGHLEHLYIWHDNCGEDDYASWYLNQVMVYDIEEKKVYTFVAERWLSVETSVDANLVAIDPEKPVKFESRFFFQTRDRLSESHMWVSILYRPAQSTFTRVQRASCALVYIFLTMIANAMYFNPDDDYQSPPLIQVGPFRFTPQQIFISIVCAIITTPPVMLLIFLFKRTKRKSTSSCGCACCACACTCCPGRRSKKKKERESYEQELRAKQISTDVPDFSGGFYLPHWCIIFAWLLVFVGTVVPAFFILLYSMQWGKQKSEEWLTTFLMSIFESMLCVDPVMVISIALILACCIRSSKSDINVDIAILIENYERTYVGYHQDNISSSILLLKRLKTDYLSYQNMPRHTFPPLKGQRLNEVAGDHQHQLQLTSMFRDILLNLFFMFIIFSICYGSRDDRSYMHHRETMNTVVEPTKMPHFHSIKTPGDMFTWLNVTAIPHLFPYYDINGNVLHWYYRGFTTGLDYFRLGPPRLRQLRAKPDRCSLPYFGTVDCYGEYTLLGDEDMDYCLGWADKPCPPTEEVYNVSGRAWEYTSAIDIWGLPIPALYTTYGGGGYIAQLDVARSHSVELLTELFDLLWLDRQTRAVMFEYTLYCPATNIFVYHLFVVEYPQTGGAVTFLSIYPIRVYNHVGPMGTFTLVCEVIFVIYLIMLLVKLCVRLYQQGKGFFGVFWQVYEMIMFCVGIAACVIYAIKFGMTYLTIEKYKDDIEQFVNFAHLVFWDQMLVMLLAILVFMATLRILEAFASSKKVSAIAKVFKQCGKDLFWYGMAFLHMLFGFCMFGYLLFGKQLVSYMNLFECLGTLFIAMIGKSKYTDLNETQPILAEIFFILYIMVVVFFTLTLFLSILGASIDAVVQGDRQEQKEDLVEHMMKRFKLMFGKHGSGGEKKRVAERKASYRKYIYPTPFQVISLEKIQEKASESRQERSESAINNTRLPSSRHRSNVVVPLNSE